MDIESNGYVIIVDSDAWDSIKHYNTHVFIANGKPYARFYIKHVPSRYTLLHRFIIDANKGQYVDHINGNTLDNRRCNLRTCTQSQNMMNYNNRSNNKSGIKGVNYRKDAKKWQAYITVDKKWIYLGMYKDIEDAIYARINAEKKYYGVFSRNYDVL